MAARKRDMVTVAAQVVRKMLLRDEEPVPEKLAIIGTRGWDRSVGRRVIPVLS